MAELTLYYVKYKVRVPEGQVSSSGAFEVNLDATIPAVSVERARALAVSLLNERHPERVTVITKIKKLGTLN